VDWLGPSAYVVFERSLSANLLSGGEVAVPTALILYHYFHPDDVVSARHIADLACGLHARGWTVRVMPSNRACRGDSRAFASRGRWKGVEIRRVWRPRLSQSSATGRLLSALWMLIAWCLATVRRGDVPDVVIFGSDPVLSVVAAWVWKLVRPGVKAAHWCFDLYPEAAEADGLLRRGGALARMCHRLAGMGYRACDLLVDIGPCMRERLRPRTSSARRITVVPWSLVESNAPLPTDPEQRREAFGEAALGVMYSGNFGRAHSHQTLFALARRLHGHDIRFAFSVRGNRVDALRRAVTADDTNVTFLPFAPLDRLRDRLGVADVHLVSLRPEWTGTVVPSKFFGALAAGRPVVFCGSRDCGIARWIEEHHVGWVLTPETLDAVADDLARLADSRQSMAELGTHCHQVYHANFSRSHAIDCWDRELRALLGEGE